MGNALKVRQRLAQWQALWSALGVDPPAAHWFDELQQRYGEPHRAYHTLQHIDESLAHFQRVSDLATDPPTVVAALWFHDVIYEPKQHDNEAASAAWAGRVLQQAGVAAASIAQIQALILYTMHNQIPPAGDAALLVDIDLAILGASPARFAEYETQIRHEYAWVPWATYCSRRAALLQQFLARPLLYQTAYFQEHFAEQARDNLAWSLARLMAGVAVEEVETGG